MQSAAPRSRRMISYAKYGYLFILPFFLVYAIFMIYPLINTILLSFKGNGSSAENWVGFQNYQYILFGEDGNRVANSFMKEFWRDFGNTLILWIGNFVVQIILSLLLAVWFSDVRIKTPGAGFLRL